MARCTVSEEDGEYSPEDKRDSLVVENHSFGIAEGRNLCRKVIGTSSDRNYPREGDPHRISVPSIDYSHRISIV